MAKARRRNQRSDIYGAFLTCCRPAELPAPWDRLTPAADCFSCPLNPDAALTLLQEQFSQRDLLRSHLTVRTRENGIRLRRCLRRPTDHVVALRKHEGAAPFDLVAEDGCLSQTRWPVIACLDDHTVRRALADFEQQMLVCFSMQELVVCRSLGLPACLSVGLDDEGLDLLDELAPMCEWDTRDRNHYLNRISDEELATEAARFQALEAGLAHAMAAADATSSWVADFPHLAAHAHVDDEDQQCDVPLEEEVTVTKARPFGETDHPGEAPGAAIDSPDVVGLPKPSFTLTERQHDDSPLRELTILGWQLPRMSREEPHELPPLANYLRDVDEFLGIELATSVNIWTPDPASFRLIEKRLEHGVLPGAASAVLDSYRQQVCALSDYGDTSSLPPSNFAEAAARIPASRGKRAAGEQVGSEQFENRVEETTFWLEELLDRDVFGPMLEAAVAATDPVRKTNLLLAARLGRILHREAMVIDQWKERAVATALQNRGVPAECPNMKGLLSLADRLVSVTRELRR